MLRSRVERLWSKADYGPHPARNTIGRTGPNKLTMSIENGPLACLQPTAWAYYNYDVWRSYRSWSRFPYRGVVMRILVPST